MAPIHRQLAYRSEIDSDRDNRTKIHHIQIPATPLYFFSQLFIFRSIQIYPWRFPIHCRACTTDKKLSLRRHKKVVDCSKRARKKSCRIELVRGPLLKRDLISFIQRANNHASPVGTESARAEGDEQNPVCALHSLNKP